MILMITMIVGVSTVRKNHKNHGHHGQKITNSEMINEWVLRDFYAEKRKASRVRRVFFGTQPGMRRPNSATAIRSSCSWPSCCRHNARTNA